MIVFSGDVSSTRQHSIRGTSRHWRRRVRALVSRLSSLKFNSWPPQLVLLGWVTGFGRANHLIIWPSHPGQLSLLPSLGWEIKEYQPKCADALRWGVKSGVAHSTCGQMCGW